MGVSAIYTKDFINEPKAAVTAEVVNKRVVHDERLLRGIPH